jgi:trehalose 6-phosphate phosphatase
MTLHVTGFAYFLDIDGTLVDLADTPRAIALDSALSGLVDALYESSGGEIWSVRNRSFGAFYKTARG